MPLTPPAYLQAGTYTAALDRMYLVTSRFLKVSSDGSRARPGILPDLPAWSAPISVTGFAVTVGPYRGIVSNTFAANAGDYLVCATQAEVRNLTGSSPTTNRIDLIGFRVRDAFYTGADNDADLVVIPGLATAGTPVAPGIPPGFTPLYQLLVGANSTTPVVTDLRKRTGPVGSSVPIFANQVAEVGSYVGEKRILPQAGGVPTREQIWGDDGVWHGVTPFTLDFGGWVISSTTTDRAIATLAVPDPGYPYRLMFNGSVWVGIDPNTGWFISVREGAGSGSAGAALYGAPGAIENRQSVYSGPNSVQVGGASGILTGSRTVTMWIQRKFGVGGGAAVDRGDVTVSLVPA